MAASKPLRDQNVNELSNHFVAVVAEEPFRFRIGESNVALLIGEHHSTGSKFKDGAELALAGSQIFFRAVAHRGIVKGSVHEISWCADNPLPSQVTAKPRISFA